MAYLAYCSLGLAAFDLYFSLLNVWTAETFTLFLAIIELHMISVLMDFIEIHLIV